jgi:peptide-methionine (S)-S-oxide reductase
MKAMFAAGCFWHVQFAFDKLEGIIKTEVGYAGGNKDNPSYEEVCSDTTGHAEVVLVEYDEKKVSYEEILNVFFKMHNPTQLNRQGPDVGKQYRSAIFYYNEDQKDLALKKIKEEQNNYVEKIVTEVKKAPKFYKAEEYHQDYFKKNGRVC